MSGAPPRGLDGPSGAAWSGAGEPLPGATAQGPFDHPEPDRYQRGHPLGRGGMGRVTQVFDRRLGREVAMKELVDAGPEHEARLIREASLTAGLDHPGIVSVHDAGRTPEGTLYYTMRVVRGRSLAVAIADAKDLDARLRLLRHVLDACEAVAFAHRHGVVHRDLKPANIMVGELGETQVLDWGLARQAGQNTHPHEAGAGSDDPELTRVGQIVGTPRYMSPEQAAGEPATPRSDVWSLGVLLHELCTGRPALLPSAGTTDAEAVLAAARAGDIPEVRSLEPRTPPELAAIIGRALARPASARYPDAAALASDLEAWLDGRRVAAHDYTTWELLVRLVRAWRVPLLVGAAALVASAIGLALAFAEAEAERDRAISAEDLATAAAADARRSEQDARAALTRADAALAKTLVAEARARAREHARPEAELLAARALALTDGPEARGVLLALAIEPRPTLTLDLPLPPGCAEADLAPDRATLACREASTLSVWRLTSDSFQLAWRRRVDDGLGVAFLGRDLVLTAARLTPLAAFDRATGAPREVPAASCCAFAPHTNHLGLAIQQVGPRQLTVVTEHAAHELSPCTPAEELAGAVSPDGALWAATCRDGSLRVGPLGAPPDALERASTPLAAPSAPASALAFIGPRRLVLGATDGRMVVFDLDRGVLHDLPGDGAMIRHLEASPDGRFAVALADHGGPRVLHLPSGTWRARLPDTETRRVRFLPGAPADLATLDARLRVWRLPADSPPAELLVSGGVTSLTAAPDGRLALTRGRGVELRDAHGALLAMSDDLGGIAQGGAFAPDGRTFAASAGINKAIPRWSLDDGFAPYAAELPQPAAVREVASLAAHAGAEPLWLATLHAFGVVLTAGGPGLRLFADLPDGDMRDLVVTRDGRPVFLSLSERVATLEGDGLAVRFEHPGARALAVGPDPGLLALAEADGVAIRELDTGAEHAFLPAPNAALIVVAWSPEGALVAAGDRAGRTWLWDLPTRRLIALFRDHTRRVSALAFAPDGAWLASGSWDQSVRFRTPGLTPPSLGELERAWGLTLAEVLSGL